MQIWEDLTLSEPCLEGSSTHRSLSFVWNGDLDDFTALYPVEGLWICLVSAWWEGMKLWQSTHCVHLSPLLRWTHPSYKDKLIQFYALLIFLKGSPPLGLRELPQAQGESLAKWLQWNHADKESMEPELQQWHRAKRLIALTAHKTVGQWFLLWNKQSYLWHPIESVEEIVVCAQICVPLQAGRKQSYQPS